jgi:hypothetical protein
VYAQPLVLSNLSIGGGTHNVVYVATENDSVYAIDANNGTIYWHRQLLYNGGRPIPTGDFGFNSNITPQYGITGTPVIDAATNTLYVVASSEESGPIAVHRLHALNTLTGADQPPGYWVVVGGSFDSLNFNPALEFNRPGLLLLDGHVIVAFGKHSDTSDYGWVFSYNATTLAEEAAFGTDPVAGSRPYGGIWMGGDGIAADPNADLFFSTANGDFDDGPDYGNSIIKLGLPVGGAFPFLDYFAPHDQGNLNAQDWDLGSGGVLVLPDLASGAHPHLLVQSGKEGTIYLVDRTNMGKYCGSSTCTDAIVQELTGALVGGNSLNIDGVWGSPAYWNGYVYFGSANKDVANVADYMKAYSFNAGGSGLLSGTPTSHTPEQFAWPAPSPSVSSNGTSNGTLWVTDNSSFNSSCCQVLHAYNATNLADELYSIELPFGAIKFSVPTVANGELFVGSNGALTAFGLTPGPTNTVSPTSLTISTPAGCQKSLPVVLKNTGPVWMGIYTVSGGEFGANMGTCNSFLSPGQSCAVNVTYAGVPSPASGKLYIYDSGAGSPQTVSLTGYATGKCIP